MSVAAAARYGGDRYSWRAKSSHRQRARRSPCRSRWTARATRGFGRRGGQEQRRDISSRRLQYAFKNEGGGNTRLLREARLLDAISFRHSDLARDGNSFAR